MGTAYTSRLVISLSLLLMTFDVASGRLHMWYNSHLSCANHSKSSLLLSIVAVTSNTDDQQIERLQVSLNALGHYVHKYSLLQQVEVVLVEYNYDPKRPPLSQLLKLGETFPLLRIFRVGEDLHRLLVSKMGVTFKVSFLEYPGKNIGIRRSCGKYVLVTNPDIVLSETFWLYISKFGLAPDAYYRIPRCNADTRSADLLKTDASKIQFALQSAVTDCWCTLPVDESWHSYVRSEFKATSAPAGEQWKECIFAPGDFTMLPRSSIFRFRGYPEVALPTMLDDVVVWQAVSDGLRLVVMPKPTVTYHINHAKGYNSADDRWRMSEVMRRAYGLDEAGRRMMQNRAVEFFNDDTWGLNHVTLEEFTF